MKNIVILISGRGSNMEALIAARDAGNLPVNIAAVISNRPDAQGLETAAKAGIVTHYCSVISDVTELPDKLIRVYRALTRQ